ncbi:MAG: Lrp/AsnC family transcriptional regulator [Anaerolineae bacterium]
MGYQSTLAALHLPEERLEAAAAVVSAHPGVSHNYARPHHYNLWFTLAVPPGQDLAAELARLAARAGAGDALNLPALRVFKIRTHFRMEAGPRAPALGGQTGQGRRRAGADAPGPEVPGLGPEDVPLVRALQRDLPLVPRPFAVLGGAFDLDEAALLAGGRRLLADGIMRRYAAVLRHRRAGFRANGMACWVVPGERVEEVGRQAAAYPEVSHCYQRPAHPPRWPFNLFTMIHGRSRDEVEAVAARLAAEAGLDEYEILYSTREFKKERVKYFEA